MLKLRFYLLLPVLMATPLPVDAQILGRPIIVSGSCDAKSGVIIDDGEQSQLGCDTSIITRTERGTVLIQFTDKQGDDGRILGFAGTIEGKQGFGADKVQVLAVERFYLGGGVEPISATAGTCFLNWTGLERTGGRITSVTCGGRGNADNHDVKAISSLTAR